MLNTIFLPIALGSLSGLLYGFFFLVRRKRIRTFFVPLLSQEALGTLGCLAVCGLISFYLLPLPLFPFILVITSFFALFWTTVIWYKGT